MQLALPLEIAEAVRGHSLNALAIGQHQRHPRAVHVAHVLLDIAIELGKQAPIFGRLRCRCRVVYPERARSSGGRYQSGLEKISASQLHVIPPVCSAAVPPHQ